MKNLTESKFYDIILLNMEGNIMTLYFDINDGESGFLVNSYTESAIVDLGNPGDEFTEHNENSLPCLHYYLSVKVDDSENWQDILDDFKNYFTPGDVKKVKVLDSEQNVLYQTTSYDRISREELVMDDESLRFNISLDKYYYKSDVLNEQE